MYVYAQVNKPKHCSIKIYVDQIRLPNDQEALHYIYYKIWQLKPLIV